MIEPIEVWVRLDQPFLDRLDAWCRHQTDRPERSVAVVRLAEEALTLSETLLRLQARS